MISLERDRDSVVCSQRGPLLCEIAGRIGRCRAPPVDVVVGRVTGACRLMSGELDRVDLCDAGWGRIRLALGSSPR